MVVAHEKGLAGQIETERMVVGSAAPNPVVMQDNPLNKIPTLILDDGSILYDSRVICEYLDDIGDGPKLFPSGPGRLTALRLQALGDGLMEAILLRMGENNRAEATRSARHLAAFPLKIAATVDRLETEVRALSAPLHIGAIAVGSALAHLDFRFASDHWREGHPALAAWHAELSERPSMLATEFHDEY